MDKKLIGLSLIFILMFTVFMGALMLENPTRIKARNARVAAKCLCFAKPILQSVKADGKSVVTWTCSVTDSDLNIVPGKIVSVQTDLGNLDKSQTETGDSGIAQFKLTSTSAGTAKIQAQVGELACEPKEGLTIEFI